MPKILIEIQDGKFFPFEIINMNKKTHEEILKRIPKQTEAYPRMSWRQTYLNYVIKDPCLTIKDWGNVPVSIIDKIFYSIMYYIRQIGQIHHEIRESEFYLSKHREMLDGLVEFVKYYPDESVENRIEELNRIIETENMNRSALINILNDLEEGIHPIKIGNNVYKYIKGNYKDSNPDVV